ncbi:hypothetical protein [Kitasatospora sp. NPDC057500]|uniref:hypothetical protein n=1 Tax=Kitasatospora sp. NPDC057500 TaxID=3346151 RepID=UPI00368D07E3
MTGRRRDPDEPTGPPPPRHGANYGDRTTTPSTGASPQGASWFQILPPSPFSHVLATDNTVEHITELPALTIPYAGVWQISYGVHENFALTAAGGTVLIHTVLYKNAAAIPGTEAVTGYKTLGAEGFQATTGQTVLHAFAAQDRVTLRAHRAGGTPSAGAVISSGDGGTTQIAAHWVSPGF